MIIETSDMNFRQHVDEFLNQVHCCNASIVINKDGKPIATLVDAGLFARIRRIQLRFDLLGERLAQGFEEVPPDAGMTEINASVKATRQAER